MALTEEEKDKSFKNVMTARKAITDKEGTKKPSVNIQDSILCPVCFDGQLHYRISSYNGHIHARCTAEHCVSWME